MKLTAILRTDTGEFDVHAEGCADIARTMAKRGNSKFNLTAGSRVEAANEIWTDFVSSGEMTEDDALDATNFINCCKGLG